MTRKRTAGGILAALWIFVLVWEQIQSIRLGYELERTRQAVETQRGRNAYLRLDLQRESSPEWISSLARVRLGMSPLLPENLILLGSAPRALESRESRRALRKREPSGTLLSRLLTVSAAR
ncbi:MAG: hypothetical protein HY551_00815 [Elusimicrobia bacterium]|nr:hypothetical protein [Elusimicrobiota bacterium]